MGTLMYMSPERLQSKDYSYKCDYWSMALVIMEAALGYYPIQKGMTHVDVDLDVCNHS